MNISLTIEAAQGRGEDRAAVHPHPSGLTLALADGAGGTGGGDLAAQTFVDAFVTDVPVSSDAAVASLRRIDFQLFPSGAQTTGVVIAINGDQILGASVGDSEAWLVHADRVEVLTARQPRKPLLGSGRARPRGFEAPLGGAALLIASDGLFKYAPRDLILERLRTLPLKEIGPRLVDAARMRSGGLQDDVAILVAR